MCSCLSCRLQVTLFEILRMTSQTVLHVVGYTVAWEIIVFEIFRAKSRIEMLANIINVVKLIRIKTFRV